MYYVEMSMTSGEAPSQTRHEDLRLFLVVCFCAGSLPTFGVHCSLPLLLQLNSHFHGNGFVGVIANDFDILVDEVVNIGLFRVNMDLWEWARSASQLLL